MRYREFEIDGNSNEDEDDSIFHGNFNDIMIFVSFDGINHAFCLL